MKLEFIIYDNRHNKLFEVSDVITKITISSFLTDQPTKCEFTILKTDDLAFWEGASVAIKVDNVPMFKGFVFKKKRNKYTDIINVTAYDQLRYLQNKDSYVFEGKTSSQIFTKICQDFVLQYKVVDASSYVCAPRTNDGKSLYDMIKSSLADTLINTGDWFIVRDNFGVLEHVNILSLNSGLLLGDGAGIDDFDYETSIDQDVYNQVKLYQDDKQNNRIVYVINDTINGGQNLKEWGIIQLYEKVDSNLNEAQIKARAKGYLDYYNHTKRDLTLKGLGYPGVTAGSTIRVKIADIGDLTIDKNLVITECVHTIENERHQMSCKTEVII